MNIHRPDFPSPILVIDEFLTPGDAAICLQECIDLKPVYMPAIVGAGTESRLDRKIRRNDTVHLDTVFAAAPERSNILTLVKKRILDKDCNQLWHKGDYIFDVINYANWRESVLSRYGQCDFYGVHQDTVRNKSQPSDITKRLVTLVYYMNTEPEKFTGGGLTMISGDQKLAVTPKHNRAVVFPSFTYHSVENVTLPEGDWSGGRFSLNHWIGFKS
jgi:2-oxoglutarate-Fe(II)-dependent oxygenase superfamily protein